MNIREQLKTAPLLFDGAFGTYYAARRCDRFGKYEEANLAAPGMVRQIAFEYLQAGCNAIKTNTFGANRASLGCGRERLRDIILAACRIANAAVEGRDAAVFADIGPIPRESGADLGGQYRELVDLFLEGGVRNFLFETLSNGDFIPSTAAYIREKAPDSFIIASFAVAPDGFTRDAVSGKDLLLWLQDDPNLDALGFNCVSGPYHLLQYIKTLPPLKKPLSVSPNAGYPTVEEDMTRFASNPVYFARQMAEIVSAGASIIGGCCGTTPEHIHEVSLALQLQDKHRAAAPKSVRKRLEEPAAAPADSPFWDKLQAGQLVIAAELDPPAAADISKFMRHANTLREAGADILTVADCPVARVRADSSMVSAKLKREAGIEPLPHINCRDRNTNATKALLLGLSIEEIRNVLVITGDPVPTAERSEVKSVFNFNAVMLANYIRQLGADGITAPFHIWAALNVNAPNFDAELQKARRKAENGVAGFLTQPVFTQKSIENLRKAKEALPGCYFLGGIIPVISWRSAAYMNSEVSGIDIPQEAIALYEHATKEEALALAVDLSCRLARDIRPLVDGYYLITPAGRPSVAAKIIQAIRAWEARD